jgi:DNA-directed RNA polymerase alpha subunit
MERTARYKDLCNEIRKSIYDYKKETNKAPISIDITGEGLYLLLANSEMNFEIEHHCTEEKGVYHTFRGIELNPINDDIMFRLAKEG